MVKRKRQVERCVSLMRIAILDDDPRFSDKLYQKISMGFAKRDWALNCRIFSHPQDLLNSNLGTLHAVFLDVDMPEMNGLEVASIWPASSCEGMVDFSLRSTCVRESVVVNAISSRISLVNK